LAGKPIIINLSDIIGPCKEDLTVTVLAEALQKRLKIELKGLALFRYQRAWGDIKKVSDQTYVPSESSSSSD
jgi:molybdopterin-biosynthesis enzyme MoeA-like protein